MFQSGLDRRDNSARELLEGWSFENEGDESGKPDSLFPVGTGPQRGKTGSRRIGPSPLGTGRRSDRDSALHQAFQVEGEADADAADSSLKGNGRLDATQIYATSEERAGPPSQVPVDLPRPGEALGGFLIRSELGRGAFARVYLAEQSDLGRRLVALKVSRAEGEEPQILARLQHTHIVPIFSAHDDPATGLRLLCMPYFGGANLAQVLDAAGARLPTQGTGRSLVEALDLVSRRLPPDGRPGSLPVAPDAGPAPPFPALPPPRIMPVEGPFGKTRSIWQSVTLWKHPGVPSPSLGDDDDPVQPARRFLRSASSSQAAVWIVARLAEGLDHAHSRGLLHRDLKPSNILIAADGTPMLLDFNLSAEVEPRDLDVGAKAMLGGTLPYMSPEHLDAFHPIGTGTPRPVDERSDLYALGLILFEMIAGHHPFPEPPPSMPLLEVIRFLSRQRRRPPSLRASCLEVSWGLDSIVAKCLDPDPDRRYRRARDLAEDLRRFLDDRPLQFAPDPSLRERAAKWGRRHPRLCAHSSIAGLAAVLLLGLVAVLGLFARNNQALAARLKLQLFENACQECQFRLNLTTGPDDHLGRGLALADRTIDGLRLNREGDWRRDSWVRRLTPDEQLQVRGEATELILLAARARVHQTSRQGSEADRRQALEWAVHWLGLAERLAPRPVAALYADRARDLGALGQAEEAKRDRDREARTLLVTSRDYALRGTSRLAGGAFGPAEDDLGRATNLDPRSFWAWFALGLCHFDQGRYLEAAGDFALCTAREPKFAWPFLNRGTALASAGRERDALACFDRALELDPDFTEALASRASAYLRLNDVGRAERDLTRAVELGSADAGTLAALGEVMSRRDRLADAEALYARWLKRDPDHAQTLIARGTFRLKHDPKGARADLTRALELRPGDSRTLYALARLSYRDDLRAALNYTNSALDADRGLTDARELRAMILARLGESTAVDDVDRLLKTPTPHRLYNASCALAVLSETAREPSLVPRALALLGQALDAGIPASVAESDPDWQPICNRTEFRELIRKAAVPRPPKR